MDCLRGIRRLHSEELRDSYFAPNIRVIKSRRRRWAEHVECMGMTRDADKVLVGKPKENRPFGRPRCGMENNIKVYFQGGMRDRDWPDRLTVGTGGLL